MHAKSLYRTCVTLLMFDTPYAYRHKLHDYKRPSNYSFIWGTACINSIGGRDVWRQSAKNVILLQDLQCGRRVRVFISFKCTLSVSIPE